MGTSSTPARIRFGEFELDPASDELTRESVAVGLQPQPARVLKLLASRAGQVVTREEIQQEIWGSETHVDFEQGLNFCIRQIRRALDDGADSPHFIQTVPRRGYRFIARVESSGAPAGTKVAGSDGQTSRFTLPRLTWASAAALGVLLALGLAGLGLRLRTPTYHQPPLRLAVLPFSNLTADPGRDYLSDGLTEELIAELAKVEPDRLGVIARTSVMPFKGGSSNVEEIGRALDVGYVLEGSLREERGRFRITAQLIRVEDQVHVWTRSYERDGVEVLRAQSEVAAEVRRAVEKALLSGPDGETPEYAVPDSPAYDAFAKARYLQHKKTRADLVRSIEYFQEAIRLDSAFAPAHAGLALAYIDLWQTGAWPGTESVAKAKDAAMRALDLDPGLAEAHVARALTLAFGELDMAGARREFDEGLRLNPGLAYAHHKSAIPLAAMGLHEEALAAIERARRLDPLSPEVNSDLGWYYYLARRYREAIEQSRRTLELEPADSSAMNCLLFSALQLRLDLEEMPLEVREQLRGSLGERGGVSGDRLAEAVWRIMRNQALRRVETGEGEIFSLAVFNAALGEKDQAFSWLEKGMAEPSMWGPFVAVEPMLDNLHDDPRFQPYRERIAGERR